MSHKAIVDASRTYPHAAESLDFWYRVTLRASWQNLAETRQDFSHADLVDRRTVFNIGGNNFRMITRINYRQQIVYVLRILTHAAYDKGDWK